LSGTHQSRPKQKNGCKCAHDPPFHAFLLLPYLRFENDIELNPYLVLDLDGASPDAHGSHPELVL
jgi:hypothetical protein